MSRSKIITLLLVLAVFIVTIILGILFINTGLIETKFMGVGILDWFQIIVVIIISFVVLNDFIKVRLKRSRYGKLKYKLKRKDKKKQNIGLVILVIIFFIQVSIFSEKFNTFNLHTIVAIYFVAMLPLLFLYRNIEKEGLGEGGIHYWGEIVKWEQVLRYSFNENKLTITAHKKIYRKDEIFEIPFIIEDSDKNEYKAFLEEKMSDVI
ncbi:hypothetical protein [Oceanirhabdus sp. W0125-5]|uniref:hypothetical protein n=1 Tax=Oceanirhabdus sp. W0125-5 TaxID=2999116 RepID=UPI0022F31D94|nr:hypothetical protein [Oceanirhabdus sp. W0125-5]WBW96302.1 hypothetical protein OW730_21795 [Oceanirhabdus sp. W0125-5]